MPDTYGADGFGTSNYGVRPFDRAGGLLAGEGGRGNERDNERCYTVSEINRYINGLMKSDGRLPDVIVSGEVTNFRPHYSGHHYFTLKDNASALRCVMFRGAASKLKFRLENGQKVMARGAISVFERDGAYQLYCETIHADGAGDLFTAFEQLKERLAKEGLFDQQRKKSLPLLPGSVCVVTSPTGSVIKDILNVAVRRFPGAVIKLLPVQVQGAAAAPQIVRAIELINAENLADVIIVARGGGALEDLWAFNEEAVARAINASEIPIVSAVGHETDFTICDFTSDVRAPTPSAAAELVFPEAAALMGRVAQDQKMLVYALRKKYDRARRRLERCMASRAMARPAHRAEFARMRLDGAEAKLMGAMKVTGERSRARVSVLAARLDALSPLATLARGYAVVSGIPDGRTVRGAGDVEVGGQVSVKLNEGALRCEVLAKTEM